MLFFRQLLFAFLWKLTISYSLNYQFDHAVPKDATYIFAISQNAFCKRCQFLAREYQISMPIIYGDILRCARNFLDFYPRFFDYLRVKHNIGSMIDPLAANGHRTHNSLQV